MRALAAFLALALILPAPALALRVQSGLESQAEPRLASRLAAGAEEKNGLLREMKDLGRLLEQVEETFYEGQDRSGIQWRFSLQMGRIVRALEGKDLQSAIRMLGVLSRNFSGEYPAAQNPSPSGRIYFEQTQPLRARFPGLFQRLQELTKGEGANPAAGAEEEAAAMARSSELAMTLEILKRSGLPLPSAGMERELDGDLHRFLYT